MSVENVSNISVSILAELPKSLHEAMAQYLKSHPEWDGDRLIATALSLFLIQQDVPGLEIEVRKKICSLYLDSILNRTENNDVNRSPNQ